MLKKKQIVIALTSAILCLGTGISFAAVQTGGAGSGSSGTGATSGIPTDGPGSIDNINHKACEEAKAKVARDEKDDDDDRKNHEEGRVRSLTHHSNDGEDGRKKHDEDREAKHKEHVDEMLALCAAKPDDADKTRRDDDKDSYHCNNGFGNGDQCAPGNSLEHNNAANAQ